MTFGSNTTTTTTTTPLVQGLEQLVGIVTMTNRLSSLVAVRATGLEK